MSIRSENGVEQIRQVSIINESGFYHAAFKSRKPEVKPFRKWVTAEVLPAIRKTGQYIKPTALQTQTALPNGLTLEQQDEVKKFHRELVKAVPKDKQAKLAVTLWSSIKSKFGVTYKSVPSESYPEVLSLMARVAVEECYFAALGGGLETRPTQGSDGVLETRPTRGEVLDKPRTETVAFSNTQLQDMACLTYYAAWGMEFLKKYSMPLRNMGLKDDAVNMITLWQESQSRIRSVRAALESTAPTLEPYTAEYIRSRMAVLDKKQREFALNSVLF